MEYEITVPGKDEEEYVGKKLLDYNLQTIPLSQDEPFIQISRCIKDKNGEIIGGILACLALWNTLSIDTLWVREENRNKGIARRLLSAVETEARDRGGKIAYLSTYDFQARDFYIKNGYIIYGVLDDCPENHKLYHLSKKL